MLIILNDKIKVNNNNINNIILCQEVIHTQLYIL